MYMHGHIRNTYITFIIVQIYSFLKNSDLMTSSIRYQELIVDCYCQSNKYYNIYEGVGKLVCVDILLGNFVILVDIYIFIIANSV